ncbi:hypothetical protein [Pseudomonas sp. 5P_3.1_Bac2]|uniref:hypothetical protein n=1 Tax=Pseudomonas sp. 5P_3.1_Bac2 TaxID=2971617 RepID=UPI0021C9D22E|nr:hypothetical protein [Pseudomonas sp. 5P_3.1_Bac2]MCU1717878.1 hypothetical protein [Pseudomonas sp. 5P_3.1_Bac2]
MKHYFLTYGLLSMLAAVSLPAMSEESVSIEGATYQPVEVNGQRYYLKDSGTRTRTARSADGASASPGLYIGDIVRRDAVEPELRVNGGILVKASEPEAQAIAQRYGLQVQNNIGGIALLNATGSTDLRQLAARLQQEGHEVEIEVSGPLLRPN